MKQKVKTKPENSTNVDHVKKGFETTSLWGTNCISRHRKQSSDFPSLQSIQLWIYLASHTHITAVGVLQSTFQFIPFRLEIVHLPHQVLQFTNGWKALQGIWCSGWWKVLLNFTLIYYVTKMHHTLQPRKYKENNNMNRNKTNFKKVCSNLSNIIITPMKKVIFMKVFWVLIGLNHIYVFIRSFLYFYNVASKWLSKWPIQMRLHIGLTVSHQLTVEDIY